MNAAFPSALEDIWIKFNEGRIEKLKQRQNLFLDEIHKQKTQLTVDIQRYKESGLLRESDYKRILTEILYISITMKMVEKRILHEENMRELRRLNNFDLPRECPQEQKCSTHDTHNDVQKIEPSTFAPSMDIINQLQQYNANFFEMLLKK